ncbi:hypothetical protein [Inconstantimicrobium mannanitabidum]|uniref:Uncharacterized protein n=1 Tax=Inconstantimicrobium mannanitabidum TaxID=1604901 RepID=A0ACB5R9W7_9CLOT|nr:hypothetical protein [Clostridium sp. TW13]GKX65664.1 hypothetical protein rsdtw13_09220 [Clostridium sp. TW13]
METISILIILCTVIKIIYTWCINKLFASTPAFAEISAEQYIDYVNSKTLRSCDVECAYAQTRNLFNQALKSGELDRGKILAVKLYLEKHVKKYQTQRKFENDAHKIYAMLKAADIKVRDFKVVDSIIFK